jgi:hypothetical protein
MWTGRHSEASLRMYRCVSLLVECLLEDAWHLNHTYLWTDIAALTSAQPVITARPSFKLRPGRSGFRTPSGASDFSLLRNVQTWSVAPHKLLFNSYRPRRRVNQFFSFSFEVVNKWRYTSTPSICLHGKLYHFLPFTSQSLFRIPTALVASIEIILMTIFPASVLPSPGITHYALSLSLTQR